MVLRNIHNFICLFAFLYCTSISYCKASAFCPMLNKRIIYNIYICKFPLEWNNSDGKVFSFGKIFTTSCRWWRFWNFINWRCARWQAVPDGWLFQTEGCNRVKYYNHFRTLYVSRVNLFCHNRTMWSPDSLYNARSHWTLEYWSDRSNGGLRGGAAWGRPAIGAGRHFHIQDSHGAWLACSLFNIAILNFHSREAMM